MHQVLAILKWPVQKKTTTYFRKAVLKLVRQVGDQERSFLFTAVYKEKSLSHEGGGFC